MSTYNKFFSKEKVELDLSQLQLVSEYTKHFYENESLKKIERFKNNQLSSIEYFCDQSDISEILSNDPNANITTKSTVNNHNIIISLNYVNNALVGKVIFVLDSEGNEICYAPYNIETDEPRYADCDKFLIDENGEELYQFEYLDDGTCFYVYNHQVSQSDFKADRVGVDPDIDFFWTGNEYYQFAYPIIPEN